MPAMQWQDIILTAGIIVMNLALIPSILGNDKPQLSTSITTAAVLAIFAAVYVTLDLWFATVAAIINSSLWVILAYQRYSKKIVDKQKS